MCICFKKDTMSASQTIFPASSSEIIHKYRRHDGENCRCVNRVHPFITTFPPETIVLVLISLSPHRHPFYLFPPSFRFIRYKKQQLKR
jgi:hypothetical protein